MAESIILDNAIQTDLGATRFLPSVMHLNVEKERFFYRLREIDEEDKLLPNGKIVDKVYTGTAAMQRIVQLNKANLSIVSLSKRVIEDAQAAGIIGSGTITGSPD